MSESEFLSAEELRQLTGRARVKAQAEWLHAEGIPFKRGGDGLVVCRIHIRSWVEGRPVVSSGGLDWSTVN